MPMVHPKPTKSIDSFQVTVLTVFSEDCLSDSDAQSQLKIIALYNKIIIKNVNKKY